MGGLRGLIGIKDYLRSVDCHINAMLEICSDHKQGGKIRLPLQSM